jgi:hypothetical protein
MLAALKPYALLIKIGLIVAALVAADWMWRGYIAHQQQIGYDRAKAEYATKLAMEKDLARLTEQTLFRRLETANHERAETEKRLADARRAAATADRRLRDTAADFRQRLSDATAATARTAAATAAELLSECSGEYREMASAADGHAADSQQCRAGWPG